LCTKQVLYGVYRDPDRDEDFESRESIHLNTVQCNQISVGIDISNV